MRFAFELKVRCSSREVTKNLESVLRPDNRVLPPDQRFLMKTIDEARTIIFRVESPRGSSALASVESLLNDINLFKEVWLSWG